MPPISTVYPPFPYPSNPMHLNLSVRLHRTRMGICRKIKVERLPLVPFHRFVTSRSPSLPPPSKSSYFLSITAAATFWQVELRASRAFIVIAQKVVASTSLAVGGGWALWIWITRRPFHHRKFGPIRTQRRWKMWNAWRRRKKERTEGMMIEV